MESRKFDKIEKLYEKKILNRKIKLKIVTKKIRHAFHVFPVIIKLILKQRIISIIFNWFGILSGIFGGLLIINSYILIDVPTELKIKLLQITTPVESATLINLTGSIKEKISIFITVFSLFLVCFSAWIPETKRPLSSQSKVISVFLILFCFVMPILKYFHLFRFTFTSDVLLGLSIIAMSGTVFRYMCQYPQNESL